MLEGDEDMAQVAMELHTLDDDYTFEETLTGLQEIVAAANKYLRD